MTVSFYSLSNGTAIVNLALSRADELVVWSPGGAGGMGASTVQSSCLGARLYLAAVVFYVMHFAFAPRDLALIEVVTDKDKVDAYKGKDNCILSYG